MATYWVTSADVGAPALSGTNGTGITVLDFILVTNAGLTKAFSATNIGVYLMPNGDYLRVCHDSAATGDARVMSVRAAAGATGTANGDLVDAYPTVALLADSVCNWRVSSSASATARAWWALVDTTNSVFVFLVDERGGGHIDALHTWAGGSSNLAVDNYCAFVAVRNAAAASNVTALAPGYPFATPSAKIWWKRTRDGTIKSVQGYIGPYFGSNWAIGGAPAYPDPDDTKYRRARVLAGDNYSQSTSAGVAAEISRMYVPHIWYPLHAGSYTGIAIGDTFTDGAYNTQVGATVTFAHFPMGGATGSSGAVCVEITDTWSPPVAL